jgi:hypothetical protein
VVHTAVLGTQEAEAGKIATAQEIKASGGNRSSQQKTKTKKLFS